MDITCVNGNKTGDTLSIDYNDQFLYLHILIFPFLQGDETVIIFAKSPSTMKLWFPPPHTPYS